MERRKGSEFGDGRAGVFTTLKKTGLILTFVNNVAASEAIGHLIK